MPIAHLLLAALALITPALVEAGKAPRLATAPQQKAATKCQSVLASVTAKILLGKFKTLDACGNAAFACVQTKAGKSDCLTKAAATCGKKLAGFEAAVEKGRAKIAGDKSCAQALTFKELLTDDGLGLEALAEPCQSDLGINMCGSFDALASCLVRLPDHAAGALYDDARPRMGELLGRLPGVTLPVVNGLPIQPDCGAACPLVVPTAAKGVEVCAKAVTKAVAGVVKTLNGSLTSCTKGVLACVQTKPGDAACLATSRAACDKSAVKIATAFTKLDGVIGAKCGTAIVSTNDLAAPTGLDLSALTGSCSPTPTDAATLASCMGARARCEITELAQNVVARTAEFAEAGHLGAVASVLASACPAGSASVASVGQRAAAFGTMLKFVKLVQRPNAGVVGVPTTGPRPGSTAGAPGTIKTIGGPKTVKFGQVVKVPFTYKVGTRSRAAIAAEPSPKLIVTVQRGGVAVPDFFEVELAALPTDGAAVEVSDLLEVEYQDAFPACAFSLELAVSVGSQVGEYATLPQQVAAPSPGSDGTAVAGIGPFGGDIRTLVIDPQTPTTLYAGTTFGGLYKSTDAGDSWTPSDTGFFSVPTVNAIAVDPTNPSTLYAGVGSIYKSVDAGGTWTLNTTQVGSVETLIVDPSTSATVYAGGDDGAFKTTNGGESWNSINTGLGASPHVVGLAIDPGTPSTLYAVTDNEVVFKTVNGGTSWETSSTGLPAGRAVLLAVDPSAPSVVYAGLTSNSGVYKSTNGAASWSPANTGLSKRITSLTIDPTTPATVYAGTSADGVFKTTNGGTNWAPATTGIPDDPISALVVDPTTSGTVYAGTAAIGTAAADTASVFKTTDGGALWDPAGSGITAVPVTSVAVDPATPNVVYALSTFDGVFRSDDAGESWERLDFGTGFGGTATSITFGPGMPSTIYVASSALFKSTDGGASFDPFFDLLGIRGVVVDPLTPDTVYAYTTNVVSKSTNGGANFDPASTGLPTSNVEALVIDPTAPATLYAGTASDGVFKTTDGATGWAPANVGLTNTKIKALLLDPELPSTLYASTDAGVFKTTNGGTSWSPTNTGLSAGVTSLGIDAGNPAILYASSAVEVFRSTNGGGSWSSLAKPSPIPLIRSLTVDPATSGRLYLATLGRGVVAIE